MHSVIGGHGCPRCATHAPRLGKQVVETRCSQRGLELLDYQGTLRPIKVRCKCSSEFELHAHTVLYNEFFCPSCYPRKYGASEAKVRKIIERITGWKFPRSNPAWLKGRGKRPLQLDGYNEKHQVAFEYQGYQHYRIAAQFGDTDETGLAKRQQRDHRKRCLCYHHGVLLIRVPYWKRDVEAFIKRKLAAYL